MNIRVINSNLQGFSAIFRLANPSFSPRSVILLSADRRAALTIAICLKGGTICAFRFVSNPFENQERT
jgi:hypothetical protein